MKKNNLITIGTRERGFDLNENITARLDVRLKFTIAFCTLRTKIFVKELYFTFIEKQKFT